MGIEFESFTVKPTAEHVAEVQAAFPHARVEVNNEDGGDSIWVQLDKRHGLLFALTGSKACRATEWTCNGAGVGFDDSTALGAYQGWRDMVADRMKWLGSTAVAAQAATGAVWMAAREREW